MFHFKSRLLKIIKKCFYRVLPHYCNSTVSSTAKCSKKQNYEDIKSTTRPKSSKKKHTNRVSIGGISDKLFFRKYFPSIFNIFQRFRALLCIDLTIPNINTTNKRCINGIISKEYYDIIITSN